MVYQSEHMGNYREIPGLQVSSREVLTPERNGDLIAEYPDLLYAVIMPWIHGCTWFDVISDQRNLGRSDSLMLAKALATIGSSMERRGLAHCDLSAPNVMLPFFGSEGAGRPPPLSLSMWSRCTAPKWIGLMFCLLALLDMRLIVRCIAGYGVHMPIVSQVLLSLRKCWDGAIRLS